MKWLVTAWWLTFAVLLLGCAPEVDGVPVNGDWPIRRLTLPEDAVQTSNTSVSATLPGTFPFVDRDVRFTSYLTVEEIGDHLRLCLAPLHYSEMFSANPDDPDFREYKRIFWSSDFKTEVELGIDPASGASLDSYVANDYGVLLTYALFVHIYDEPQRTRLDQGPFKMRFEPIR